MPSPALDFEVFQRGNISYLFSPQSVKNMSQINRFGKLGSSYQIGKMLINFTGNHPQPTTCLYLKVQQIWIRWAEIICFNSSHFVRAIYRHIYKAETFKGYTLPLWISRPVLESLPTLMTSITTGKRRVRVVEISFHKWLVQTIHIPSNSTLQFLKLSINIWWNFNNSESNHMNARVCGRRRHICLELADGHVS